MMVAAGSVAADPVEGEKACEVHMPEEMMWRGASESGAGVLVMGGCAFGSAPASSRSFMMPLSELYAPSSVLSSSSKNLNLSAAASNPFSTSIGVTPLSPPTPTLNDCPTPPKSIPSIHCPSSDKFAPLSLNTFLISSISSSILPILCCLVFASRRATSIHSNASFPFISCMPQSAPAWSRSLTHSIRRVWVCLKDWKVPRMAQCNGVILAI
mmetsp:Transcript_25399/g.45928  ORF Transcript_25399/g.45928 Transcript_25399/m.45928 type:complete len:212 (+) Transcript_25399:563-1198(+)